MAKIVPGIIIALPAGAALQAQALQILSLSPRGKGKRARQVVARCEAGSCPSRRSESNCAAGPELQQCASDRTLGASDQ